MKLAALTLALITLAGCASSNHASSGIDDSYGTSVASAKQCATCAAHGVNGKQGFEWFQSLAGKDGKEARWVGKTMKGHDGKDQELAVTYKVVSGGSAVRESLFPGTDMEMVTMYHLDGDKLTATHYCAMGNQPRMQAIVCGCDAAHKTCNFKFLDGTNMDASKDSFMGNQDYIFNNPNSITIHWHHLGPGGKDSAETFGGDFKRVM